MDAQCDKEIALADAELQKQLTGNESAYSSAVQAANDAYTNTTTSEEASRKSQEQTALSTMNTKLSDELKNKEADIAAAEREYDQTVASLDAQYGSESSNGDTGVEGATRRSAIKTRDAQYYSARDTSWANTLSGSTTLGTTPWTVKATTAANAQAAYSTNRARAQAAHDAALLSAIDNWQTSIRSSTLSLLLAEGQSRETYNKATATVFANWELGVGNLLGDTPEGTGYVPVRGFGEGGVGTWGGAGGGVFTRFEEGEDETTTSGEEVENVEPSRPTLPAPESNDSQPLIITVTDSPNDRPGAGEWLLERGRVVESCLSGKTLYCVGEWRATDSQSRNFLTEVVQPPRVDVIFIPLDQFPSRGRAYFEDDILVADTRKDIAIAAGFDPSKEISVFYKASQSSVYPLDRHSEWTDGDKTLWALESRYVKNGVSVHCGYQFFSSPEEMYRQIQAMNLEIFNAGATAMTGSAGSLQTVKPLTRANPLTILLDEAPVSGGLVGPTIGRSGFKTAEELSHSIFSRYQRYADEAYSSVMKGIDKGRIRLDPNLAAETQIGSLVDRATRSRLRRWAVKEFGGEGPDSILKVNRWLRDAGGSGYRIPDLAAPGHIFDLTIGLKSGNTPQIMDFFKFSGGSRVTIVRPSQLQGVDGVYGSYSILR